MSSETEGDLAHTQQSITCPSPSQVGEHCDRSRYVLAQSHFRGMDGKSRKFDLGNSVVNTPLGVTGPRVPLRSNLDDPEEWELPCSDGESACWDEVHRDRTCCFSPNHQVWNDGVQWVLSFRCGGIWVHSWEWASHVRDLREIFPRPKVTLSHIPRLPEVKG